MTKAILAIVFALSVTNFAMAEESTSEKINDNLNKTGDKIESAFGKDNNKTTSEKINDDLNKTGDKIEGTFNKDAVKAKKAARRAKKKTKHTVKKTEDEVKSEVKH